MENSNAFTGQDARHPLHPGAGVLSFPVDAVEGSSVHMVLRELRELLLGGAAWK